MTIDVIILSRTVDAAVADSIDVIVGQGGPMGPAGPAGGSTIAKTAAQALGGHRAVKAAPDDEVDYPNNAVTEDGGLIVGLTVAAANSGATVAVQVTGEIEEGSWNWSLGPVFCGANGVLTQTPPPGAAWLRQIGVAISPTRMLVDLQPAYVLA